MCTLFNSKKMIPLCEAWFLAQSISQCTQSFPKGVANVDDIKPWLFKLCLQLRRWIQDYITWCIKTQTKVQLVVFQKQNMKPYNNELKKLFLFNGTTQTTLMYKDEEFGIIVQFSYKWCNHGRYYNINVGHMNFLSTLFRKIA